MRDEKEHARPDSATPAPKFTKGDWFFSSGGSVSTSEGTICEGISWTPNGHLIAAAPDYDDFARRFAAAASSDEACVKDRGALLDFLATWEAEARKIIDRAGGAA